MGTDRDKRVDAVRPPQFTLREIVAALGGEAIGEVSAPLTGVATLDSAGPTHLTFLANPRYRARLADSRAGAVIVGQRDRDAASVPRIVSDNPYAYYAKAVALFHPDPPAHAGIHASAHVDPLASVDASAEVGAFASIGPGARVAARARIGAGCAIAGDVRGWLASSRPADQAV